MTRPCIVHRTLLAVLCLVVVSACATDDEAADEVTEVVTERIVVTEQETVVETETPSSDDGADNGTTDGDEGASGDGSGDDGQPFPANTARDRGQAGGEQLTLTDVRVGTHDGFDRVTFEFDGDGRPGWIVEYTDDPRAQGSGRAVDVEGDAVLGASMRPVAPPTGADAYDGPERIDAPRLQVIEEVVLGTTFEADLQAFIGVVDRVPFRARRFADPPRVVIDVVHADVAR